MNCLSSALKKYSLLVIKNTFFIREMEIKNDQRNARFTIKTYVYRSLNHGRLLNVNQNLFGIINSFEPGTSYNLELIWSNNQSRFLNMQIVTFEDR